MVMVLPSAATRNRPRQRSRTKDTLVVMAVTAVAVGAGWLVSISMLRRSNVTTPGIRAGFSSFGAPQEIAKGAGVTVTGVDFDEENLSAQNMLATRRPYIIYGTAWKKDDTADLVYQAIKHGFRFIDTACQPKHYEEAGVGYGAKMAMDDLKLKREDLFLQTKFSSVAAQDPHNIPYDAHDTLQVQVRSSVHASLQNLKTKYIDSLVMHSPMETMEKTMIVWKVLESLVDDGKIRQLGISNCYDYDKFTKLYEQSKIKPKVLQNRFYKDSNFDIELRKFCEENNIQYQSFWTLTGNKQALHNPEWHVIASDKGLTSQTLMYAYMMTLGHTPLSGTTSPSHMKEDVEVMKRIQRGEAILNEKELSKLSAVLGITE